MSVVSTFNHSTTPVTPKTPNQTPTLAMASPSSPTLGHPQAMYTFSAWNVSVRKPARMMIYNQLDVDRLQTGVCAPASHNRCKATKES